MALEWNNAWDDVMVCTCAEGDEYCIYRDSDRWPEDYKEYVREQLEADAT